MTNEFTFLMLPPQTDLTRQWARRLSDSVPGMKLVLAEDPDAAAAAIVTADAAFGTLPTDLLAKARRLRWLQAPQAAPPAGYYYSELVSHPLTVTNFREIYNDHISAHILAFVLAFARGLHVYFPQQLRREWKKPGEDMGVVPLPGATALIVGLGGLAPRPRACCPLSACVCWPSMRAGLKSPNKLPNCIRPRGWISCCLKPILSS